MTSNQLAQHGLTGNALRDLLTNQDVTHDLISSEGREIELFRPSSAVSDGAGGVLASSDAKTSQGGVQRFFSRVAAEPGDIAVVEGEIWSQKFVLIGLAGDDIQVGDEFEISNKTYEVKYIHADRSYQVKAEGLCVDSA